RLAAVTQLGGFAEDRYLHQTGCLDADGNFRLVEDLPIWLGSDESEHDRRIRVHFHVPIFAERFGQLGTTRGDIESCLDAMGRPDAPEFSGHWEIETYAWTVMPKELRAEGLGADIERELNWFRGAIERR
ncbi:MAG: xylose isomerase, partial [Planctomycetaceae bacterium]